jgi:hypothetical protein
LAQPGEGGGGVRSSPFTISTAERADVLPLFLLYPYTYVLCGYSQVFMIFKNVKYNNSSQQILKAKKVAKRQRGIGFITIFRRKQNVEMDGGGGVQFPWQNNHRGHLGVDMK